MDGKGLKMADGYDYGVATAWLLFLVDGDNDNGFASGAEHGYECITATSRLDVKQHHTLSYLRELTRRQCISSGSTLVHSSFSRSKSC